MMFSSLGSVRHPAKANSRPNSSSIEWDIHLHLKLDSLLALSLAPCAKTGRSDLGGPEVRFYSLEAELWSASMITTHKVSIAMDCAA
jgi:hypothetical protein